MHEMPPLVMVASRDEWTTRSLESVLVPAGFAVVRAYTGAQLVDRAGSIRPDAVVVGGDLADETAVSACRRLRADAGLPRSTPVLLLTPAPVGRRERIEAFEAGAWDIVPFPTEPAELNARLRLYTGAKRDAEAADEGGDLEAAGVYSMAGLLRRGEEVAAFARRTERPFACVVFELGGESGTEGFALERLMGLRRSIGRRSDVWGRIEPGRLAVVATDTDREGAQGLARRLAGALAPADPSAVRTGLWSASGGADAPADAREALAAAAANLPS